MRLTYDVYRNKMSELEKTSKGSTDAKKKERYESNLIKWQEESTKYGKMCSELENYTE